MLTRTSSIGAAKPSPVFAEPLTVEAGAPSLHTYSDDGWGRQPICKGCNRGKTYSCICDPFFEDGEPDFEAERRVRESLHRIDWCNQGHGRLAGFERIEA